MRTAISFTGGKDCVTTLHLLKHPSTYAWRLPNSLTSSTYHGADGFSTRSLTHEGQFDPVLLVTFVPASSSTPTRFLAHPLDIIEKQAAALGLPWITLPITADGQGTEGFMKGYRTALSRLTKPISEGGREIEAIATGDIDDVCNNFMAKTLAPLSPDMHLLRPLWDIKRPRLYELMREYDIYAIISCADPRMMPGEEKEDKEEVARQLVGGSAERNRVTSVVKSDDDKTIEKVDAAGERGEWHSMVLRCKMMNDRGVGIKVREEKRQKEGEYIVFASWDSAELFTEECKIHDV
ncbi:hypothetical protein PROFUN_02457 [Planoprotostelium fungivorum]|uniref:Diphthine--ammonia ligase n=1 Tax=Planoprotostelium fungivorum TaxID=1890364 RepID=A0A2P6NUV8_9EUKA|nr:hypothetical protein PROFUN_02454 [Planoprotostelium fungivorum]PRP87757.1 hypothetical protein PROFUN_02457 [Planoprotostelium fungivorum]